MGDRTALDVVVMGVYRECKINVPLYVVTMLERIGHRLTYNGRQNKFDVISNIG